MLEIVRVPVLKDNYSWLVRAEDGVASAVDHLTRIFDR